MGPSVRASGGGVWRARQGRLPGCGRQEDTASWQDARKRVCAESRQEGTRLELGQCGGEAREREGQHALRFGGGGGFAGWWGERGGLQYMCREAAARPGLAAALAPPRRPPGRCACSRLPADEEAEGAQHAGPALLYEVGQVGGGGPKPQRHGGAGGLRPRGRAAAGVRLLLLRGLGWRLPKTPRLVPARALRSRGGAARGGAGRRVHATGAARHRDSREQPPLAPNHLLLGRGRSGLRSRIHHCRVL